MHSGSQPHVFRLHRSRVYYVREEIIRQAISVPRASLVSLGVCLGKFSKTEKFRIHVTALDLLARYAKNKVRCVRDPSPSAEPADDAHRSSSLQPLKRCLAARRPFQGRQATVPDHKLTQLSHRFGSRQTAKCHSCTVTTSSKPISAKSRKTRQSTRALLSLA